MPILCKLHPGKIELLLFTIDQDISGMSTAPRVVFLANDAVFDWVIAFLESFRDTNPDLVLYMIPFADDTARLSSIASTYDFEILDLDLRKWDELAGEFFPGHPRKNQLRKLAIFELDGPPTIYLDIDIVVLKRLDFLAEPINKGIADFICTATGREWVYNDDYWPEFADTKPFSDGFFCFDPEKVNRNRAYDVLTKNRDLYLKVRSNTLCQPVTNFIVHLLKLRVAEPCELFAHIAPSVWSEDREITIAGENVVYCDRREVLLVHWSGSEKYRPGRLSEEFRLKALFDRYHTAAAARLRGLTGFRRPEERADIAIDRALREDGSESRISRSGPDIIGSAETSPRGSSGEIVVRRRGSDGTVQPVEPLRYLHRTEEYQVIWFEGGLRSDDLLPTLLRMLDRRTYLIYTFAWFTSRPRLEQIFAHFRQVLTEIHRPHVLPEHILLLMNSREEWNAASALDSPYQISFVNHNCLLDPQTYTIQPDVQKRFTAVYNARGHAFKRHYLSHSIKSKIFITYDNDQPDSGESKRVDLSSLAPEKIFRDISDEAVSSVLNSCHVGLMLSEEEGACYASTEYLLCGLPVVSTESRGGRDEYYNTENSIIVPPDPALVAGAADRLVRMLATKAIDSRAIRDSAVRRTQEFREAFFSSLGGLVSGEADCDVLVARVRDLVSRHSKLRNYRNFFLTGNMLGMATDRVPWWPRVSGTEPTIVRTIYKHARQTPDKTAIVSDNRPISYRRFASMIDVARHYLAAQGVAGEGIAVQIAGPLLHTWVLGLALRSLGVTTFAVPPDVAIGDLGLPQARYVVSIGQPEPGLDGLCGARGWLLLSVPTDIYADAEYHAAPDPAMLGSSFGGHILLTSGTTGRFKRFLLEPAFEAVVHRHLQETFSNSSQSVVNLLQFRAWTAIGYRHATSIWDAGGGVVIYDYDGPNQWESFLCSGITHAFVTPFLLSKILAAPEGALKRDDNIRLVVGGGPLTPALWDLARQRLTSRIDTYVGSTEVSTFTVTPIESSEDLLWHRVLPTREVQVVDEEDRVLPPGEVGQVRVRLLAGAGGYLDDAEASRRFFRDGYFYTGDLGVTRSDGRLGLRGRVTEIINILGIKMATAPIEVALQQQFGVGGVCLFSLPQPGMEEEIHLAIEAAEPIARARVAAALDEALPGRSTVLVHYLPAMPRGDMGKIQREALKRMVLDGDAGIAVGTADGSARIRRSKTTMRLLIYAMQSSGASSFCYFLAQRPGSVAIVDLWAHCLAPSLKLSAPMVVKATATAIYRAEDHIASFSPDRTILFLRDPRAVYTSLVNKPYGNEWGTVDQKIARFDEDYISWNWDLVLRYEDFVGRNSQLVCAINDIGWPCTPEYYDLTRSFQDICNFNALSSSWLRSGFGGTWGFGNIEPGPIRDAFTDKRYSPRTREKVARLAPRLTRYYESVGQQADHRGSPQPVQPGAAATKGHGTEMPEPCGRP